MGIKNAILRVADKAGNAVAGVSALSSAQLDDINKRRESYLSQRPDPSDQTASELTNRLLAAAAVEIQGAYLAQLRDLYQPIDPSIEYQGGFDDSHNIRFMNITKWVVDPDEDSLEKLVNVYDVLADEDCTAVHWRQNENAWRISPDGRSINRRRRHPRQCPRR